MQGDAESALERLSDVLEKDLPHFYSREEFWRERGTIRDEVCFPVQIRLALHIIFLRASLLIIAMPCSPPWCSAMQRPEFV